MFTCGLLRSNFSFPISPSLSLRLLGSDLGDDFFTHALGNFLVGGKLHRVVATALRHRLDELVGDRAALDLVLEDEMVALFGGLDPDLALPVLAPAARLPDEPAVPRGLLRDRLAVGDLRLADVGADVELAHHPVGD